MTDWTSISVTETQKQTLKDAKPDGVAMGKFLVDLLEGDTDTDAEPMQVVPVDEVVGREVPQSSVDLSDVHTKLDRIDGALGDTVEKALEIGDSRNAVQLEATEYRKIADELEGRLR